MSISFTVQPLYVEEGSTRLGRWLLRRFQEEVLDVLEKGRDSILIAPTGSGKTLSLLLGNYGFVGVYPNNTLLIDQQRSIHKILVDALGARLTSKYSPFNDIDVLRIYEPSSDGELPITNSRKIAVVLLSGRYIGYEYDEKGRLVPKRVTLLRNVVDRICYPSKGEELPYVVTLATPDTALMIMSGIYRDFEKVGYTLHDFLLSSMKGHINIKDLLSKYMVATVGELGDISTIRQCLLKYPWFIDEFHLYGIYEAHGLLPVLKVYRDYAGWEEPFVLSSATPKGALYEIIASRYKLEQIEEHGRDRGDEHTLVREETRVEVKPVDVPGRGPAKWFRAGYKAPDVVKEKIYDIMKTINDNGRVFIVVDRVNQVPGVVGALHSWGITPECSVSIRPAGCSEKEELVLVGSESISQGIDRSNVKYGIITAYNWASLIQRFGRIGRKTSSKVIIVVPRLKSRTPLESLDGLELSYKLFTEAVMSDFPDFDVEALLKSDRYRKIMKKRSKLIEYASTIAFAQVSDPKRTLDALAEHARREDDRLLDMIYGPPETIARTLTFRKSGFPVIVKKPDNRTEETDIATVLRNYNVKKAYIRPVKTDMDEKSIVKNMVWLDIDLEPARLKLVLERDPARQKYTKPDVAGALADKITTIGELLDLGYRLVIRSWDNARYEVEIPVTTDVREQAVALLKLSDEFVIAHTYMVNGVEVVVGERSLIGLFV